MGSRSLVILAAGLGRRLLARRLLAHGVLTVTCLVVKGCCVGPTWSEGVRFLQSSLARTAP